MIHLANPLSRPVVIFAWFWSFVTDWWTDNPSENSDPYQPGSTVVGLVDHFICISFYHSGLVGIYRLFIIEAKNCT